MRTMRHAEYNPNFPISVASCSNFSCRGVGCGSYAAIRVLILPMHD